MSSFISCRNYLKQFTAISTLILTFCFSNISFAETSIIDNVFNAQIHSYYSINGFYNFSANQGSRKELNEINESSDNLKGLIESLGSTTKGKPSEESFKKVDSHWKAYSKLLAQNIKEVRRVGYPDLRLAGELAISNIALNRSLGELQDELLKNEQTKPSKFAQLSRETAVTLALMMTKYSARSTSTISQVYADGTTEVTIDELANQFESQLTNLLDMAKEDNKIYKVLDSSLTTWDFIKNSYINYNENRVNFIVNLYSKNIISDITESIALK